MNITQTDAQITIVEGGSSQIVAGFIFLVLGVVMTVAIFGGLIPTDSTGKKIPTAVGVVGIVFAAVGLLLMKQAQKQTIVMQKGGDTTVKITKILGGKTANQSFPTNTIAGVRLSTYIDTSASNSANHSTGGVRRSDLSVVLNNNSLLQLGSDNSNTGLSINGMNVGGLRKAPLSDEANQVATFLNVPLDAQDASTLAGAVHSVVDAFHKAKDGSTAPQPAAPATPPIVPASPEPQPQTHLPQNQPPIAQ